MLCRAIKPKALARNMHFSGAMAGMNRLRSCSPALKDMVRILLNAMASTSFIQSSMRIRTSDQTTHRKWAFPTTRQLLKACNLSGFLYWGDQPFTTGPIYLGAIVCMLFILSMVYLDGKHKWWILTAAVLGVLMAFGKHFPSFNYLPVRLPSLL